MAPPRTGFASARLTGTEMPLSLAVTAWFGLLGLVLSFAAMRIFGLEAINQAFGLLG